MKNSDPKVELKNYSESAIQALAENAEWGMAPFGKAPNGEPVAFMVGMNHITVPGYEGTYTCNAMGLYQRKEDVQPVPVFLLEPSLFKDLPNIVIRYNGQPLEVEEYGDLNAIEFFEYLVMADHRHI